MTMVSVFNYYPNIFFLLSWMLVEMYHYEKDFTNNAMRSKRGLIDLNFTRILCVFKSHFIFRFSSSVDV